MYFKGNFFSLGYRHAAVQQRELSSIKMQVLLTTSWKSGSWKRCWRCSTLPIRYEHSV